MYRWVEDLEPPLFRKIQAYVREGRWAVVNGWWLQPDCNLPSGEAFLRQALYGRAYFDRAFGDLDIKTAYNVDSFGHAATLPMLLRVEPDDSLDPILEIVLHLRLARLKRELAMPDAHATSRRKYAPTQPASIT